MTHDSLIITAYSLLVTAINCNDDFGDLLGLFDLWIVFRALAQTVHPSQSGLSAPIVGRFAERFPGCADKLLGAKVIKPPTLRMARPLAAMDCRRCRPTQPTPRNPRRGMPHGGGSMSAAIPLSISLAVVVSGHDAARDAMDHMLSVWLTHRIEGPCLSISMMLTEAGLISRRSMRSSGEPK